MNKISTTKTVDYYLDLNQLQMALQEKGSFIDTFKTVTSEVKKEFLFKEAERLGIPAQQDLKELLVQVSKKVGSYGIEYVDILTEAVSDKDIDDSTTRIMYRLLSLDVEFKKKAKDTYVDSLKEVL